jgi:hypothetical protein
MIWERLLTDSDGQYSEIQSGRMFNQADSRSSLTPFKNRGFSPGSTDQWTEYWFPVKGTNGLKFASPTGSVNLEKKDNTVNLWFCPNENITGILEVRKDREVLYSKVVEAKPLQVLTGSFEYTGNYKGMNVWLNGTLLYDADTEKGLTRRPAESPRENSPETSYRHFLNGTEFERQRLYTRAEKEFRLSLETDRWFIPALNGVSRINYRKGDYAASMELSLKALSIDTYDADANMMYGLSGLALGDTVSAIDGFSIASFDVSVRSAAYNKLASICIGKGEYQGALAYAENSLLFNSMGSEAVQLKILCLRKLGRMKEAEFEITELEKTNPLNHFIRFERFIKDPSGKNREQVIKYISNELPQETFLEYAIWYYRNRQIGDALKVLGLAPEDHPVILLWKGYLNHLAGNNPAASDALDKLLKADPRLVFPFRPETLTPLEWAEKLSDSWKIKYYEGLVYLGAGNRQKGEDLWKSCGEHPDFYPFYFARAELYEPGSIIATGDVKRALELAGDEWRAGWIAAKYFLISGDTEKAEEIAGRYYKLYPGNFNLGIQYAQILEENEKYVPCLDVLDKIEMLPSEGSGVSRNTWRNANLGYARQLMAAKKYRKALEFIEQARKWPLNLGVGRPYNPDERREDALALECYQKLNDSKGIKRITGKMTE